MILWSGPRREPPVKKKYRAMTNARPILDGERVRCPSPRDKDHPLAGCGSLNVYGPDSEGLYDCINCGLWFDEENARAAIIAAVQFWTGKRKKKQPVTKANNPRLYK